MEYEMGVQFADDDEDKKRNKKSEIKKKAIKFTKIISLVGLRHATDSRNSIIRRFVWLLWVVFGLGLAVYQIQDRISYYYTFPADTEVKLITEDKYLPFPQVTICDDKPEPYTSTRTTDVEQELKKLREAESKGESGKNDAAAAVRTLRNLLDRLHNETSNWEELSKNQSLIATDDAIVEVSFDNKKDQISAEKVVTDLGHCFAFSTGKHPLRSSKGGAPHGLHVQLKASTKYSSVGFKIFIHDPLVIPKVKHDGIELRAGTVTRIAVSLEDVTCLGTPYDTGDPEKPKYRLVSCLKNCDYDLFERQNNCRDIHMEGNGPVCSYANILNFTRVFGKQVNTTSNCSCEPECYSRNYKRAITQTTIRSYGQTVYLYVYYERFAYMRLQNVAAFTFLELLCEIGGALSLLLGATLLTVYETVEFLLLFIKDYLHMRFAK